MVFIPDKPVCTSSLQRPKHVGLVSQLQAPKLQNHVLLAIFMVRESLDLTESHHILQRILDPHCQVEWPKLTTCGHLGPPVNQLNL